MKRRASDHLLTKICAMRGIDTSLFEHEEEWALADAYLMIGIPDEEIIRMEGMASELPAHSR